MESKPQASEQDSETLLKTHEVALFRPTTTRFDPRRVLLPDSFFEPTSSELSSAIRSYAQVSQKMNNATLQTRKMREAEEQRRMSRFRKVMIRILFPDRVALQGVFVPQTTIRQVQQFVKAALRDDANIDFNLFVTPPKRILKDTKATLWSEGLVPAALIHFGSGNSTPSSSEVVRPSLLEAITDAPEATAQPEQTNPSHPGKADGDKAVKEKSDDQTTKQRKVPKWFKSKK